MGKILIIAEKPSVARDIAAVLKVKGKGDNCLISDEYIISWAIGHLVGLSDPDAYNPAYKKWDMAHLPIIPDEMALSAMPKTKTQLGILKKLMNSKEIDYIVCATDSGREGELIFRYIYNYVKCSKPVKRLWISSMTAEAIKSGFEKLKPSEEYDNLYESAKCRSEADWLVGINASRAYTINYGVLLSIGRVQTPTLNILVRRQKEIEAHIPKDYWQIKADFDLYSGLWIDLKENENKIFEEERAAAIHNKIKGQTGTVESIKIERKGQIPGLLYDLTLLQRECNRRFSYSAKTTLQIAQDLYEKRKLITYPRTDSQHLPNDMKAKVLDIIKSLPSEPYGEYVDYLTSLPKLPMGKRMFDNGKVSDHHAIIPTGKKANLSSLSDSEKNIYDMIIRKFLAAFYPPYIYEVTKIITEVCEESFLTTGISVVDMGWKALYTSDKSDEEELLPNISEWDEPKLINADLIKKKTEPPKPYTEGELLNAMENAGRFIEEEEIKHQLKDSGIGTPATRASIIERIIDVGYVIRKGKVLLPTDKGVKLIEVLPDELKSPETTGKWEKGLSSIAKGNMDSTKFMESIGRFTGFIVESSNKKLSVEFDKEERTRGKKTKSAKSFKKLGSCPICEGGAVLENRKAFYCDRWKDGCKFSVWKNFLNAYEVDIDAVFMEKLLKSGKIEKINMYLPQTKEKCTGDVVIDRTRESIIQVININRL
ncbi:MAG: DNA topoisomerase III [Defluviitaleaceae bacterium]|nr:DNA topoisomerase III [Defluviitaleaceae bacterium]